MGRKRWLIVLLAGLLLASVGSPARASHDTIWMVSLLSDGTQANLSSLGAVISDDGRFVAFDSHATNLVPSDTNGFVDVFVRDRQTGTTSRVSVATGGGQATGGGSTAAAISADGRYVAFQSDATNLVSGDTNGATDIFVHDRQSGTTSRVSVATGGGQATGGTCEFPAISGDGRYVTFFSDATNLVSGDTNGVGDIFIRDRVSNTTTRVSVATGGGQGDTGVSGSSSVSADGRYVAFVTVGNDLVSGDTNGAMDVFVRDRQMGTTSRVSVATGGGEASDNSSNAKISADGRFVAFVSYATDLVSGDTNGAPDIFVRDRQTGATSRVSVAGSGAEADGNSWAPAISADGRRVAFHSLGTNLVSGDTNGTWDIFVHDRQTGGTVRASVANGGGQSTSGGNWPAISGDGRYVAFHSGGTDLVVGDTNNALDIFVRYVAETGLMRDAGPDRYATTAAISRRAYPFGADTVYVAVGTNFPDALGAGPAAAKADAPLLLVQANSIPGATATELSRLSPDEIVIVGGTGVISSTVQTQLGSYAATVTRQWGADRYATAADISLHGWPSGASTVYVAVGTNFPDALGAGPAAAHADAPLLLVQKDSIPPATLSELLRLAPARIVIVGGTGVISLAVETQLAPYAAVVVRRLWGADRYATAAEIAKYEWPETADVAYVAVGTNFPDALGAGSAAAHLGGPLLLVQTNSIPGATATRLSELDPSTIVITGGAGVVSSAVETQLGSYVP